LQKPESFVFFLIEDFSLIAFANAIEPLRIANLVAERDLYRWRLASENGRTAKCSNGSVTNVDLGLEPLAPGDRLMVVSGVGVRARTSKPAIDYLRKESRRGVRLGAICSGAYVLAKAGLLNGHSCAIHWEFHDAFMEEFHEVVLRRSVFVSDGPIPTASGGPAAADLMLHLIAETHGSELASAVADQMIYNAVRPGDAPQRISFGARYGLRSAVLNQAVRIMETHREDPLPTSSIAANVGISTRQLERLFGRYLNCSPRKYYLELRLQRARNLLMQTDLSMTEIGFACGFTSPAHFARSYRQTYGASPGNHRLVKARSTVKA
jgi:transcriptional regulator GlxA family with amidase domain